MGLREYNKYFKQPFTTTYLCIHNGKLQCGTKIKNLDTVTIKKLAANRPEGVPWFVNETN